MTSVVGLKRVIKSPVPTRHPVILAHEHRCIAWSQAVRSSSRAPTPSLTLGLGPPVRPEGNRRANVRPQLVIPAQAGISRTNPSLTLGLGPPVRPEGNRRANERPQLVIPAQAGISRTKPSTSMGLGLRCPFVLRAIEGRTDSPGNMQRSPPNLVGLSQRPARRNVQLFVDYRPAFVVLPLPSRQRQFHLGHVALDV